MVAEAVSLISLILIARVTLSPQIFQQSVVVLPEADQIQ